MALCLHEAKRDVDPHAVQSWFLAARRWGPQTIENYTRGVTHALKYESIFCDSYFFACRSFLKTGAPDELKAIVRKVMDSYLAMGCRPGVKETRTSSFEPSEWRELFLFLRSRAPERIEDAALFLLQLTGLRVGDLLRLRRDGLLSNNGVREHIVLFQKGNRVRTIPSGPIKAEWEILASHWHNPTHVTLAQAIMCSPHADHKSGNGAYKRLKRRFERIADQLCLNHPHSLHRLRRTVAVTLLRETGDIKAAQAMLGHSSIRTTLQYLDEANEQKIAQFQEIIVRKLTPPFDK